MRAVRVEVTGEDIAAGVAQDVCLCPIALALARVTGRQDLAVGAFDVERLGTREPLVALPVEALAFVGAFDAGEPVHPFAFDLELP